MRLFPFHSYSFVDLNLTLEESSKKKKGRVKGREGRERESHYILTKDH
jgi:hypothetical protein